MNYKEIIDFWFEELKPSQWFEVDEALDLKMTEKYIALHSSVVAGEYSFWRSEPLGRLAEILVIDQFSRNIYRDDPKSFIYDPMSLALAQEAIRGNFNEGLTVDQKRFLYLPFMHSESKVIHNTALLLFSEAGLEDSLESELAHKGTIERFGRYPQRNHVLDRESTPEEIKFLTDNNGGSWQSLTIKHESISIH